MGWLLNVDDDRLPDLWPAFVDLTEDVVEMALTAAREDCQTFAPPLTDPDNPPASYVIAQAMQARAIARAGFVGSGDQMGGYGEGVTVYPMDWHVKQLLRPKKRPNPK